MLALCMSLVFDCYLVFPWWVLPTSWLSEGHSVPHLLFSVVQVWTGCVGAGSSMYTRFWDISLALVQWFLLSNFSTVYLYLWINPWLWLVWLPLSPSPSSVLICWWFLCWWVSSSKRYPDVHSFYLLVSPGLLKNLENWSQYLQVIKQNSNYCFRLHLWLAHLHVDHSWPGAHPLPSAHKWYFLYTHSSLA